MRTTTSTSTAMSTGCVESASLFQNPLMEEPPNTSAPAEERRRYQALLLQAQQVCAECPLQQTCLYDAVVRHDVAGFVAGTSRRDRMEMRRELGITVQPEDFDTLAGVTGRHRQVDHDEVVRLRKANPHESLETLAQRMGCSLSTVKRHLRKARNNPSVTPLRSTKPPTMAQVLAAFRTVFRSQHTTHRAARRRH